MKHLSIKIAISLCLILVIPSLIRAQVGINNVNPNNAAVLDLGGTDRGFLLPRMSSAQRTSLPGPVQGLLVYDTQVDMPYFYRPANGGGAPWQMMSPFVSVSDAELRLHSSLQLLRLFMDAGGSRRLHVNGGVSITADNADPSADYSLRVQNNVNVGGGIHASGNISTDGQISAASINISGGITAAGVVPIGGIIMWSGAWNNIPAGWALCDGQDGRPDLRGRFIVGYHEGITEYNLTRKSGKNPADTTITLAVANLPAHNHAAGTLVTGTAGAHSHTIAASDGGSGSTINNDNDSSIDANISTSTNGDHTHTITGSTANTGSGSAFGNRPPWYVLAFIIRIN